MNPIKCPETCPVLKDGVCELGRVTDVCPIALRARLAEVEVECARLRKAATHALSLWELGLQYGLGSGGEIVQSKLERKASAILSALRVALAREEPR